MSPILCEAAHARTRKQPFLRHFSSKQGSSGEKDPKISDPWKPSKVSDGNFNRIFNDKFGEDLSGFGGDAPRKGAGENDWLTADEFEPWKLGEEELKDGLFDFGDGAGVIDEVKGEIGGVDGQKREMTEEQKRLLAKEEKAKKSRTGTAPQMHGEEDERRRRSR